LSRATIVSHCEFRVVAQSAPLAKRKPFAAAIGIQTSMSLSSMPVNPFGATPMTVYRSVPRSIVAPIASSRPLYWRCQKL
jgi:hypothetical protein